MGSSLRPFASFAAQDCELDSKLKPFAAKIAKRERKDRKENLELEACSELHPAIVISGRGNGTKAAVSRSHIRKRKALVISHVEHLGANLQLCPLVNLEFFLE